MFGNALSGWHLVIILFIILLLFGAPKLPGLARSLGQSMKIFKTEIKGDKNDEPTAEHPKSDGPVDPANKP
ncbi:twin-arginine translocase TatA/TatE family subunit [Cryobacterium psychrophilum]|uniref:Sec-independent protein translocase protein TatA n=1 Tax=Cryobacterium psychrophilum TaxID=41988 RepID=A0A4Y8KQM8_9MICO|nr:twin-arginine translocase TatA/TatE family subunit [Cryobacterium psychrophilum]TDW28509.1 sec-independent protein translocase protein TatA [Cryobacterium psychrophilum]TFD80489.1 twin-arginine translocase TatA/TatE family subunit [Cryobacterium psychrophilum]